MILAIDTATRWLGLALHDGTAVLAESGWRCLNNHTIELTPAINEMMQRANLNSDDLDGIAVALGPGSYSGLRVGLAVAKGLAYANQTPLLGVMTLDILAASIGPQTGKLVVVAEAGRTRVVTAVYAWQQKLGWHNEQTPVIETWPALLARLADEERLFFTGEINAEAVKLIREANKTNRITPPAASARRAGFLAEIGWRRLRRGQIDNARDIAPIYLKDPDGS